MELSRTRPGDTSDEISDSDMSFDAEKKWKEAVERVLSSRPARQESPSNLAPLLLVGVAIAVVVMVVYWAVGGSGDDPSTPEQQAADAQETVDDRPGTGDDEAPPTPAALLSLYKEYLRERTSLVGKVGDDEEAERAKPSPARKKFEDACAGRSLKKAVGAEGLDMLDETLNDIFIKSRYLEMNLKRARRVSPSVVPSLVARARFIQFVFDELNRDYRSLTGKDYERETEKAAASPSKEDELEMRKQVQEAYNQWRMQQDRVRSLGSNVSTLDITLERVAKQKYENLKREFREKTGKDFVPE